MPRQIHQILPYLTFGDAIGNLVLETRSLLREWGYSSETFAENWDPCLAKECHSYHDYARCGHHESASARRCFLGRPCGRYGNDNCERFGIEVW